MKQTVNSLKYKAIAFVMMLISFQSFVLAQGAQVEINGNDVGSWFGRNWLWVSGLIALLILIILFSGSRSRSSKTTVVRDRNGDVRHTTSTTVSED